LGAISESSAPDRLMVMVMVPRVGREGFATLRRAEPEGHTVVRRRRGRGLRIELHAAHRIDGRSMEAGVDRLGLLICLYSSELLADN